MSDLAKELREALDDPKRYEWGEGPWEHLGDAERDVRRLLDEIEAAEAALAAEKERADNNWTALRAEQAALADTRRVLNNIEAMAYEGTAGVISKTDALRSIQNDCSRALAARPTGPTEEQCGSFGCTLPAGHNRGRADIPENHRTGPTEGQT